MIVKSDKIIKDFSEFIEAKKQIEDTNSGKELEKALYDYMNLEGWDNENKSFIDFHKDYLSWQISNPLNINEPSDKEKFTYAFCKLFGNMKEVHYEQLYQLVIQIFKIIDERSIRNKINVLIDYQCVIKTDKNTYKILPEGIQTFKDNYKHLDDIIKKRNKYRILECSKA